MEPQKFTVTAIGKNRIDVLNRITSLYLQKNIPVESFNLSQSDCGESIYRICAETSQDSIERIVNQMSNIVEIRSVNYSL